ncbi:MAG: hypothetical protein ACI4AQ_02260 [Lachnospiraceae bacterium]
MIVKRNTNAQGEQTKAFWEKERQANLTRRKNIDNLDYITICWEALPFLENPSEKIANCEKDMRSLEGQKILNLNGISNTDLKLTYGVANLPQLTEYDTNYLRLNSILAKWGQALLDEGYTEEARKVLELGVETGCDSSSIYLTLKSIYDSQGIDGTDYLISKISTSNSLMKNVIIEKLSGHK